MTFTTENRPKGTSSGEPAKDGQRKYLIGGNWKANGTLESVTQLINDLNAAGPIPANCEVVVAAPYLHIPLALMGLRDDIAVSSQNCNLYCKGAYTGEVCASQLIDMGVNWVILGHSERRDGFGMQGESDDLVVQKAKMAFKCGMNVMFCIGEKKEERENGTTMEVCARQLKPAAEAFTKEEWAMCSIAYEPVWAIGTGLTATPEMAQETHADIRKWMAENVGEDVAAAIRIQYGGSIKGANAEGLLSQPDIDGGLIGGASLKPTEFFACINACPAP